MGWKDLGCGMVILADILIKTDHLKFPYYRAKVVVRVVLQLSPGFKMAAAGLSSHLVLLHSKLGRLFQGSMQINWGTPGLDQIRQ